MVFVIVFYDAMYCDNFNFQRVGDYVKKGYNIDAVHYELLVEHYSNFYASLRMAIVYDLHNLYRFMHKL